MMSRNLACEFIDLVSKNPQCQQSVAVIDDDGSVTYNQLVDQILGHARYLESLGLQPNDSIVIMQSDSIDWLSLFFGAMYIGCVIVPLPTTSSASRLAHVLDKSQAKFIFCDDDLVLDLASSPVSRINRCDIKHQHDCLPTLHLFAPNDPAIWLSSSGTGGLIPKLVVHTQQSAIAAVDILLDLYGRRSDDVVYSTSKMYFQLGLWNNFWCLFNGSKLVVTAQIPAARLVLDLVKQHGVTFLTVGPAVLLNLSKIRDRQHDLSTVRWLASGGEVLPESVERNIMDIYNIPVMNGIGMAEVIMMIISNTPNDYGFQSIGKVSPGVEIKILDENRQPVAVEQVGELWVRCGSVAQYYVDEPETTNTNFVNGWYKTNDLVRQDLTGRVYYIGRNNDCIKINGQFVSPVAVEKEIYCFPGVADCMVSVKCRQDDKMIVVANIVMEPGHAEVTNKQIQDWLAGRLEPHCVPRYIQFVNDIPRTPTQKKIRSQIKVPDVALL